MTRFVCLFTLFLGIVSSFGRAFAIAPQQTSIVPGETFDSYLISKFGYSTATDFDDLNLDDQGRIWSSSAEEEGEADYPYKYLLHQNNNGTYTIYFPGAKRADATFRGLFKLPPDGTGVLMPAYQFLDIRYVAITGSRVYLQDGTQNGVIYSALAYIQLKTTVYVNGALKDFYFHVPVSGTRQYTAEGVQIEPNLLYLPAYWTDYQYGSSTVIQPRFFVNPGRVFLLDPSIFDRNITPQNSSQCQIAYSIAQMWYVRSPYQDGEKLTDVNVVLPNDSNLYNSLPSLDSDSGGEIDIYEWASRRDRFNPVDDSVECNNTVLDPENPEDPEFGKSEEVELGPNTREWFDQELSAQNRWLGGSGDPQASAPSTIDLPDLPPIDLPSVGSGVEGEEGAPPTAEGAFDRFNTDLSTAVDALPQTQKGKELFSPVTTGDYAKWSLPMVEVEVIGSATDVDRATELRHTIDLTSLSFDFEALHDPKIERFFLILRSVLALLIYAFTAWRLYRLFAGLVSNSTLGGDGGDE